MSKIIIVDENDNEIGAKERRTLNPEDIYRVSALWITNSNGEVLLAQRNFNKKHDPGKWGPAVAGTVEEGETYESNIIKEAKEELGLENIVFQKGLKFFRSGEHKYFGQWYFLKIDKLAREFIIQKEEVEQVKWFSKNEFYNLYLKNPSMFLDNAKKWFDEFKCDNNMTEFINKKNQKGFTLIELLLVIGIIAILMTAVILAMNPTRQFAQARNSQRLNNIINILNAVHGYAIDKGDFPLSIPESDDCPNIPTNEICKTGAVCTNLVDLSELTINKKYLISMFYDPTGDTTNGTGYYIAKNSTGRITVCAPNAELGVTIDVIR